MSNLPLPDGWIQRHDPHYNRPYWVDTRANPPRAIWVHPYGDEQFRDEHPEASSKRETLAGSDLDAPPPYDAVAGRCASGGGSAQCVAAALPSPHAQHKRGMFGRWKDKAIGTKEEREEHKRVRAEQAALAEEEARRARMRRLEEQEAYMRAHGGYAPYHPSYPRCAGPAGGPGGDGTPALLLGGLVGGLLLGEILGGGF